MYWIGLQTEGSSLKWAKISKKNKQIQIEQLRTVLLAEEENVNPLYFTQNLQEKNISHLISGLKTEEVLFRELEIPIQDSQNLSKILPFQIESHIPYPPEEGVVAVQVFPSKSTKTSKISLLATKISSLTQHLDFWKNYQIDPDEVSCLPAALCRFLQYFFPYIEKGLLLYMGHSTSSAVYIEEGKLVFSHAFSLGSDLFFDAMEKEPDKPSASHFLNLYTDPQSYLYAPARLMQKELDRVFSFLAQKLKELPQHIILTGHFSTFPKLKELIATHLPEPMQLLSTQNLQESYDSTTLEAYAVPIGLALDGIIGDERSVNFCQKTLLSSPAKKRTINSFFSYAITACLLLITSQLLGYLHLSKKENYLKEQFLVAIEDKNTPIRSIEELETKLLSAESRLLRNKLPYSLDPSTPSVSEFLAWISSLPSLSSPSLEISKIHYDLVGYPTATSPKELYLAKVSLQIDTTQPVDIPSLKQALLQQDSLIDGKKEFTWETKDSTHLLSFFLKNKGAFSL